MMKKSSKKANTDRVIVIGTSAGGREALVQLVRQLPADFDIPILIVQHISSDATGNVLLESLNQNGHLMCVHASDSEPIKPGFIYVAPSDHHLMIRQKGIMMITKGAVENRSRPAIDPLFRSAAIHYGTAVIAVLLTGYLDDGTSGLLAIQQCGGSTVIQDPKDAAYPDMPMNALTQLKPDFCVPVAEMGVVFAKIAASSIKKRKPVPDTLTRESKIAERVLSDLPSVNALGDQVPFNCPGCGGVLWKIKKDKGLRYRCHTGHAYTAASLLAEQTTKIEETMWTALRMFEERRNLLMTIANEQSGAAARSAQERADLSQVHIDRIRAVLLADDKGTSADIPR